MPCWPQVPPKNGTGHLFGCLQSMETLLSFSAKGEQCNLNREVNYSNGNFSYRLSDVRLVLLFSRIEVSEMPLLMKNVLMANTFHNVMVILGFVWILLNLYFFSVICNMVWLFLLLLKCSPGLGEADAREIMGTVMITEIFFVVLRQWFALKCWMNWGSSETLTHGYLFPLTQLL